MIHFAQFSRTVFAGVASLFLAVAFVGAAVAPANTPVATLNA